MTEHINNYSFDFEREVRRFRRALGDRADKILFVDVGTDHRNRNHANRAFMRQVIGSKELQALAKGQTGIEDFADEPDESSKTSRILPLALFTLPDSKFNPIVNGIYNGRHNELILGHAVLINQMQYSADALGKRFSELYMLCTLYHETAHALIERGPTVDKEHPQREADADAFAALMLLQRFGQEIVPFLRMKSWMRTSDAETYGDTTHFTSPVIDKIIFDSQQENFPKLSIDDMLKRAASYTDKYTPRPAVLKQARHTFGHMLYMKDPVRWLLGNNSLSRVRPNNLAVYIAAKNSLPVLQPELRVKEASKPKASEVRDANRLAQRAARTKFTAAFNNRVASAASDATLSKPGPTIADIITPRAATAPPLP